MTTIQAVIFDVGGVLLRTEDRSRRTALDAQLGLAPGSMEHLYFNSDAGQAAQRGELSTVDHAAWLQRTLGLTEDEWRRVREEFWAGDRLDTELVRYIRTLRTRYQTAVISNAMDDLRHVVTDLYPMADAFDLIVGSAYEGIMKPDARIFQRTLERLGREPEETVFIDDLLHNVEGAQAVGMHAVHFRPGIDLPAALADLGVVPG